MTNAFSFRRRLWLGLAACMLLTLILAWIAYVLVGYYGIAIVSIPGSYMLAFTIVLGATYTTAIEAHESVTFCGGGLWTRLILQCQRPYSLQPVWKIGTIILTHTVTWVSVFITWFVWVIFYETLGYQSQSLYSLHAAVYIIAAGVSSFVTASSFVGQYSRKPKQWLQWLGIGIMCIPVLHGWYHGTMIAFNRSNLVLIVFCFFLPANVFAPVLLYRFAKKALQEQQRRKA